jgi:Tfp pilus assembly protein PilX
MNRLLARLRHQEEGAALVICLAFLAFFGVVAVALLNYTDTSIRGTISYREARDVVYAADGAVEGAIHRVRVDRNQRNANSCFQTTMNGQSFRVDCSGTNPTDPVTFTVCPSTAATPCPASDIKLVAVAQYSTAAADAGVKISSWSVKR